MAAHSLRCSCLADARAAAAGRVHTRVTHAQVTLVIPWLAPPDQALVYNGRSFETPAQQEAYVREWARARTGLPCDFKVAFYPGRYAVEKCSILPVGDPTAYIPDHEVRAALHPTLHAALPLAVRQARAHRNMPVLRVYSEGLPVPRHQQTRQGRGLQYSAEHQSKGAKGCAYSSFLEAHHRRSLWPPRSHCLGGFHSQF